MPTTTDPPWGGGSYHFPTATNGLFGKYGSFLRGAPIYGTMNTDPNWLNTYASQNSLPDYIKNQFTLGGGQPWAETPTPDHWQTTSGGDTFKDANGNDVVPVGQFMSDPGKYFRDPSKVYYDPDLGYVVKASDKDAALAPGMDQNSWHTSDYVSAAATIAGGYYGANYLAGTGPFAAAAAEGAVPAAATTGATTGADYAGALMLNPGMEGQALLENSLLNSGILPGSEEWVTALTSAGYDASAGAPSIGADESAGLDMGSPNFSPDGTFRPDYLTNAPDYLTDQMVPPPALTGDMVGNPMAMSWLEALSKVPGITNALKPLLGGNKPTGSPSLSTGAGGGPSLGAIGSSGPGVRGGKPDLLENPYSKKQPHSIPSLQQLLRG